MLAQGGSRERARVKGRKLPGALGETAQVMYDMAFKQSLRAALAPPAAAIATGTSFHSFAGLNACGTLLSWALSACHSLQTITLFMIDETLG